MENINTILERPLKRKLPQFIIDLRAFMASDDNILLYLVFTSQRAFENYGRAFISDLLYNLKTNKHFIRDFLRWRKIQQATRATD